MLHHDDLIEEVETNIDGRPLELTGPQIYLFASKELGSSLWTGVKSRRKRCQFADERDTSYLKPLSQKEGSAEQRRQSRVWYVTL